VDGSGYTGKNDFNAEEGFTLMPDGTVLTFDVKKHPKSESYDPTTRRGASSASPSSIFRPRIAAVAAASTIRKDKCYYPPGEVGPAVLRPDGTVFATGAFGSQRDLHAGHRLGGRSGFSERGRGRRTASRHC